MSELVDRLAEAICFHMFGPWSAVTEREHGKSKAAAKAALEAMREPSLDMVRAALVDTDLTLEHLDYGAEVMEGMPPARPELQVKGIEAAADLYRDWQAMIDAALPLVADCHNEGV